MGCIEGAPEVFLVPERVDRRERQDQGAVEQVTPDSELLDPVQTDRPRDVDDDLIDVRVERARTESRASRKPREIVGQLLREVRDIVEGDD